MGAGPPLARLRLLLPAAPCAERQAPGAKPPAPAHMTTGRRLAAPLAASRAPERAWPRGPAERAHLIEPDRLSMRARLARQFATLARGPPGSNSDVASCQLPVGLFASWAPSWPPPPSPSSSSSPPPPSLAPAFITSPPSRRGRLAKGFWRAGQPELADGGACAPPGRQIFLSARACWPFVLARGRLMQTGAICAPGAPS